MLYISNYVMFNTSYHLIKLNNLKMTKIKIEKKICLLKIEGFQIVHEKNLICNCVYIIQG